MSAAQLRRSARRRLTAGLYIVFLALAALVVWPALGVNDRADVNLVWVELPTTTTRTTTGEVAP